MLGQATLRGGAGAVSAVLVRDGALGPAATFARASPARWTTAAGLLDTAAPETPRADHDPMTGAPRGVLIEPARTNHLLASDAMAGAPWQTLAASVAADTVAGPDGSTRAETLTESMATGIHTLYQSGLSYAAGQPHTLSVFAKTNGRERLQLVLPSTAFGVVCSAVFDLTTGAVVATEGPVSHGLVHWPGGWMRCAVTATSAAGGTSNAHVRLRTLGGSSAYAGDGVSGVHLWGAQLERGEDPSSPIATVGAPATRAADSLTYAPPYPSDLHLVGQAPDGTGYPPARPLVVRGRSTAWTAPPGLWSSIHARTAA
ncbi:phage head spike fiber domain-containing protein [Roseospira visakhapatnamensis]|uniref:Uncharacterized protein n=1 Tax=Roseospira visakhapatnamensis TaxID=390880 RepID=A0A7W6WA51_9PROT|nr:hypothetical protein [Roseospira visakhapatnamensis]MBB4266102.1 hypothetical protein [Roseospira visakhapatnamensis]